MGPPTDRPATRRAPLLLALALWAGLGAGAALAAAPVVSITAPASGATLSGTVTVSANATSAAGIASVEFTVDGVRIARDTTKPYSVGWGTKAVANGSRRLAAVATDRAGRTATATRTVTVANATDTAGPTVSFSAPAAGATLAGSVAITATASDPSGVASVRFAVDGQTLSTDTSSPYAHAAWNTAAWADGAHTLSAVAIDTRGNTRAVTRQVAVANAVAGTAGPALAIDAPAAGAEVAGVVDITATASDPDGVVAVRFAVDGDVLSSDVEAPYRHDGWDTTLVTPGPYELSVVATDGLGRQSTVSRTVTVAAAPGPPTSTATSLPGVVVRRADLETGDLSQLDGLQRVAADRIQVVASPVAEGSWAARFEVRQGDVWQGSSGNRAEAVIHTGEAEGDERWYQWSTRFAPDYPYVDTGFQIVTQWHATVGASQPMLVFFASRDEVGFKTVESSADLTPEPSVVHWRGPMKRGSWHTFRLHVTWSANPALGSVELWHNGVKVVGPVPVATMIPGQGVYMKQGLYRSASHAAVAVVHHDGLVISEIP